MEADVGKDKDEIGRSNVGLFQHGGADRHSADEMVLRVGLHLDEIGDEHDRPAGEGWMVVEHVEEFVGKGGVFANYDMVRRGDLSGAEAVTIGKPVERIGGEGDEVRVAIDADENRNDTGGTSHGSHRCNIAVANRRGADKPPPERVAVGFDAGIDAVLIGPKKPRTRQKRDGKQHRNETDLAGHGG